MWQICCIVYGVGYMVDMVLSIQCINKRILHTDSEAREQRAFLKPYVYVAVIVQDGTIMLVQIPTPTCNSYDSVPL